MVHTGLDTGHFLDPNPIRTAVDIPRRDATRIYSHLMFYVTCRQTMVIKQYETTNMKFYFMQNSTHHHYVQASSQTFVSIQAAFTI